MCYEMFICEIHRMEIQVIYTEELSNKVGKPLSAIEIFL